MRILFGYLLVCLCSFGCGPEEPDFFFCGDGVQNAGEECDDGNNASGDGCDEVCFFEECGNGELDEGEVCDNEVAGASDGCADDCSAFVGGLTFSLAIDGDVINDREFEVDFNGEDRGVTIADVSLTLEKVSLFENPEEVVLVEEKTGFFFGEEGVISEEFILLPDAFSTFILTFGNADAEIAEAQGNADFEGNSIRLEGTIDFDGDPGNGQETALLVLLPVNESLSFNVPIEVIVGEEISAQILIDLERLFSGVNFFGVEEQGGIVTIGQGQNEEEVIVMEGNLLDTFSFLVE